MTNGPEERATSCQFVKTRRERFSGKASIAEDNCIRRIPPQDVRFAFRLGRQSSFLLSVERKQDALTRLKDRTDMKSTSAHARLLRPSLTQIAIIVALLGITGCRNGNPFLVAPGPLNQQQASAVIHDPYPARDIAPYDLGSRPPGYEQPLPEPVRNRIVKDSMPWMGR